MLNIHQYSATVLTWLQGQQHLSLSVFLTRYRGRPLLSQLLPACGLGGKTLLAAGLAAVLLYLAGDPLPHKGHSWKLLFLVSSLYALFKSLGVLVRSTHDTQTSPSFFFSANKHKKSYKCWSLTNLFCIKGPSIHV